MTMDEARAKQMAREILELSLPVLKIIFIGSARAGCQVAFDNMMDSCIEIMRRYGVVDESTVTSEMICTDASKNPLQR